MDESNKFMRGIIAWTGFKQPDLPYDRPPRYAGEAKADFSTLLSVALNEISFLVFSFVFSNNTRISCFSWNVYIGLY